MLRLIPRYLERLNPSQDRTRIMLTNLGISPDTVDDLHGHAVVIRAGTSADSARVLVASQLVDLLVRLQPLVGAVYLDSRDPHAILGDLGERFPLEVQATDTTEDVSLAVGVGIRSESCDMVVDGAGWCLSVGDTCEVIGDGNPVGPMAAAEIGAGEAFKFLFRDAHPDDKLAKRFEFQHGQFSLWDYSTTLSSPALHPIDLDAILVGAGGVGAGVITTLSALGDHLRGRLVVVDQDRLDIYNLNRVTYARVAEADGEELKVFSAKEYMSGRVRHCDVVGEAETYRTFARRTPFRRDRKYPLVMTGLDKDEARWEVQRDLPRVLIDGATGLHGNCRVDKVRFGFAGCIGCSRPPRLAGPQDPAECDQPPAPLAPSISFLSGFTGTVMAGEAMKVALGAVGLEGYFEHIFTYPLNADLTGLPGFHPQCAVACQDPLVLQAYQAKWDGDLQ